MRIVSLFSGAGGLDLGFEQAGFEIVYANDFDKACWETYERNHGIKLDGRSITEIRSSQIPKADGIIGGPPCQSWSLAGMMKGIKDARGKLFYEYIRIIRDKKPMFFVAENVPGIISSTHFGEFKKIVEGFASLGYDVTYKLLDARDYGVPQERKRVIIVGYKKALGKKFEFPEPTHSKKPMRLLSGKMTKSWVTLKDAIGDLKDAKHAGLKNAANDGLRISNNEYMNGGFSTIYMSRNRLKGWECQSFTIQAGGRHAPLHPDSAKMQKVRENKYVFLGDTYRRLSVRECARIQTFPDSFTFYYKNVSDGYKMIGNAVPVSLAKAIALKIKEDLSIPAVNRSRKVRRIRAKP